MIHIHDLQQGCLEWCHVSSYNGAWGHSIHKLMVVVCSRGAEVFASFSLKYKHVVVQQWISTFLFKKILQSAVCMYMDYV